MMIRILATVACLWTISISPVLADVRDPAPESRMSVPSTMRADAIVPVVTGRNQYASESESDQYESVVGFRMKTSDWLVSLFSGSLVVFTALLWVSTRALWKETRDGRTVAEKAADAAASSALAAQLSTEALVAAEQPRWVVRSMRLELHDIHLDEQVYRGRVIVELANHGRTAAEVIRMALVHRLDVLLEPKPRYPVATVERTSMFGNIGEAGGGWARDEEIALTGDDVERLRRSETMLWLYGYIEYRDYLDREWLKGFIGVLNAREVVWHPADEQPGRPNGYFEHPDTEAGVQAYTYTRLSAIHHPT
jgi:hypothetical protein